MALSLLVPVGHACVVPAAASAEREPPGLHSHEQPGDEREAAPHVSSCDATAVPSAHLAAGQAPVVARPASLSPALDATPLRTERPPISARPPLALLHAP